ERRARTHELRLLAQSVKQKRRPLSALVMHDGAQRIDAELRFGFMEQPDVPKGLELAVARGQIGDDRLVPGVVRHLARVALRSRRPRGSQTKSVWMKANSCSRQRAMPGRFPEKTWLCLRFCVSDSGTPVVMRPAGELVRDRRHQSGRDGGPRPKS